MFRFCNRELDDIPLSRRSASVWCTSTKPKGVKYRILALSIDGKIRLSNPYDMLNRARSVRSKALRGQGTGRAPGTPRAHTEYHKCLSYALELFAARDTNHLSINDICTITHISLATLYRLARQAPTITDSMKSLVFLGYMGSDKRGCCLYMEQTLCL